MELKDILLNLAKENLQRGIEIRACAFATLVLFVFTGFCFYKQTERLNEHKRLLIAQQEQINVLIENQHRLSTLMLKLSKYKKHELNK